MAGASNSKIEFLVWLSQLMGGLCSRSAEDDQVFVNAAAAAAENKPSDEATVFTTAPQRMERNLPEPSRTDGGASTTVDEEFYDGIPRFPEDSLPHKPRSKVSEVSLRLGKAGFGMAVEVLDTLGSSMTNLNASSGINRELNAQRLSRDEAESIMQQLMTLVQFTAELYHELHALDRFEQDIQHKCEEDDQRGDSLAFLRAEIKSQKKQIRHLKKKSLWSRSLEEVMEKLVDIAHFLHLEISNAFGNADGHKPLIGHMSNCQRLGPAGLALHYANIVLQIDTLVAKSTMPTNTKDALYQSLPPHIKLALRSKLPSLRVVEELTVADITDEMEKTLHWLVPMATNTSKARRRYGGVGEWANTGSEVNRKIGVMRIETFHHADKDKVEYYIFELLVWLHCLSIRCKADNDTG
ncbi:hypothetical protein E2542_SST02522 [Spatholobus suberectus]|nr:hypothetical protein E2542_SST02522 [Spatholobus suberectus]